MFNQVQKKLKDEERKIEAWRKEAVGLFEDFCRENQMAVMPEVMARKNSFGGNEGYKAFLNFYPLTEEQAKQVFPKFEYRTPEESAEAIRTGKIKIDNNA
jgi:hypothetical protein